MTFKNAACYLKHFGKLNRAREPTRNTERGTDEEEKVWKI